MNLSQVTFIVLVGAVVAFATFACVVSTVGSVPR